MRKILRKLAIFFKCFRLSHSFIQFVHCALPKTCAKSNINTHPVQWTKLNKTWNAQRSVCCVCFEWPLSFVYTVVQNRQEKRVVAHQMSFTLHLGENELDLTTKFPDLLMLNNAKRKVNFFCLAISLLRSLARSSHRQIGSACVTVMHIEIFWISYDNWLSFSSGQFHALLNATFHHFWPFLRWNDKSATKANWMKLKMRHFKEWAIQNYQNWVIK